MAEYYSAELSQKVKRGLNESRQKGNFTGGYLLFGYRKDGKKLVIEENEASVIRQVFLDCANGRMIKTVIEELRQKGILCRGKPFTKNTVYRMLANEKYNGVYRHDGQTFTDIYPKIVDDELFESVRTKMEANKYGKHKHDVTAERNNRQIEGQP